MSQPFTLRCLGRPALLGPDGKNIRLRTRKHLALLVYLAVEPRVPQRRDHLTSLLWERSPASDARHSLATALSVLRGKLGREAFDSGRDWVRLAADDLDLDVDRLETGDFLSTEFSPALEVGGFLEEFDIPDAPAFGHWRDRQRARWLPRVQHALLGLMDACRRTGDFAQIEAYADRMLLLDELSEDGIRAKMEARAFAGDRLSALRAYESWKSKLAEELAADPGPLVEGMAVRLRHRGLERHNTSEIASVPTDQWKDRPFIGRGAEYRLLYEGWEHTKAGRPGHFIVLGDSGVGKSTLLHRLATAAGLEGAAIARTRGHALEQRIPYAALGGLVAELVERPGASSTAPEALASLSHIAMNVREQFPGILNVREDHPDLPDGRTQKGESAARLHLAECVERLLANVAEEQPVILIIDDVHHADDASIAVVHLLMRRKASSRIMVLMAARTAELAEVPSGQRLTTATADGGGPAAVGLEPLSTEESDSLIDSLIPPGGRRLRGTARQAVLRSGAGYPMALELLVGDWLDHGDQCLALSLDAMTESLPTSGVPADTYRRSFDRIRRQLDPVAKNVLDLAAVLGARLHDPGMYRLADLSLGQVMLGLTRLTSLRVLRDNGPQLEFVNELIRGHAYLAIPAALRRVLHGRIVDRLLTMAREGEEVPGLELAWHLIRAGRGEEAAPFLLQGAQEAILRGAPNEAERALASGMELLDGAAREEAQVLLAEAYQEQWKYAESLDTLSELSASESQDVRLRTVVLASKARIGTGVIDRDTAAELNTLLRVARSDEPSIARAQALRFAAVLIGSRQRHAYVQAITSTLSALRKSTSSPAEEAHIAHAEARLAYLTRDFEKARQILSAALRVINDNRINTSLRQSLLISRSATYSAEGNYAVALSDLESARGAAAELSDDCISPALATNIALSLGRLGRYNEQIQWAEAAVQLAEHAHSTPQSLKAHYFVAFGNAMLGNIGQVHNALEAGREYLTPDSPQNEWWALRTADVLMLCGFPDKAYELVAENITGSVEPKNPAHAGSFARWMTYKALCHGESTIEEVAQTTLQVSTWGLDCIDRVEVAAALIATAGRLDPSLIERQTLTIGADLRRLPIPTATTLQRLWSPWSGINL